MLNKHSVKGKEGFRNINFGRSVFGISKKTGIFYCFNNNSKFDQLSTISGQILLLGVKKHEQSTFSMIKHVLSLSL